MKGNLFTLLKSIQADAPKWLNRAMENPGAALASVAAGLAVLIVASNFDVRRDLEIFDWEIARVSFSGVMVVAFVAGFVAAWTLLRRKGGGPPSPPGPPVATT